MMMMTMSARSWVLCRDLSVVLLRKLKIMNNLLIECVFIYTWTGPAFWGLINPEWNMCNKGRRQSPIDISPDKLLFDPDLVERHLHIDKHKVGLIEIDIEDLNERKMIFFKLKLFFRLGLGYPLQYRSIVSLPSW